MIKLTSALLILTMSSTLMAQAEKDFGNLVPEGLWVIKHQKTSLKSLDDISYYNIEEISKPDEPVQEIYEFKTKSVKSPRKFLFVPRKESKLVVERFSGKIKRISSMGFYGHNETGMQDVQSVALTENGDVRSLTNCSQTYKVASVGVKTDKHERGCVTVNKQACDYIEKNGIKQALLDKLANCSTAFSDLAKHQESFKELVSKDSKENLDAITKLDRKLSNLDNVYEIEPKTLRAVASIVEGYQIAHDQCKDLKAKNYLHEVVSSGQESKKKSKASKK